MCVCECVYICVFLHSGVCACGVCACMHVCLHVLHVDVCECVHVCVHVSVFCMCIKFTRAAAMREHPGDPAPSWHRGGAKMSPALMSALHRCLCARVWVCDSGVSPSETLGVRLLCGEGDRSEQVIPPLSDCRPWGALGVTRAQGRQTGPRGDLLTLQAPCGA